MPQFTKPSLTDGFVSLRAWRHDDVDALVRRINDADVARFLDMVPQPYGIDDARAFLAQCEESWRTGSSSTFAVLVGGGDGPVGGLGVRWDQLDAGVAEVGYWVGGDSRRRGVATAAVRVAAGWAFEAAPGLERLELRAAVDNPASNRVAEKAGFTREGVLRSQRFNARLGRRVDFVMWSLLREEL
jgi:RimJ/RimL family protein N-acetyltransferase